MLKILATIPSIEIIASKINRDDLFRFLSLSLSLSLLLVQLTG